MLPNSLPYTVVSITERSYDLPETLQHTVRLIGTLNGETLLDFTTPTMEVVGKRFTLDYTPATGEEAELVSGYGGLLRTPPYLIEVKPTIAIGGTTRDSSRELTLWRVVCAQMSAPQKWTPGTPPGTQ